MTRRHPRQQPLLDAMVEVQHGPAVHADTPSSAVMYKVGGKYYPMHTRTNCVVCMHPLRVEMENGVLKGRSYRAIVMNLNHEKKVKQENLRAHVTNGHLPLEHTMRRAMVEERANEIGASVTESAGYLVDQVTLAREVIQQVYERVASGELVPDLKDAASFAKVLAEAQEMGGPDLDMEALRDGLLAYMDAARSVMTDEQMRQFGNLLATNPLVQRLIGRDEPIDVEVTEEVPAISG